MPVQRWKMAERVGFEPTSEIHVPLHDFQSCSLGQLGHRSAQGLVWVFLLKFYHAGGALSTKYIPCVQQDMRVWIRAMERLL